MGRPIPDIRADMYKLAYELGERGDTATASTLYDLARATYRNPPVRKAPPRSRKMTPALAAAIRDYAARYPVASLQQIALEFRVNDGRVSEALNHKW